MIVRAKISLAGDTICGLVRERNEDNFCYVTRPGDNASLVIVTDGVGGHRGGDIASYVCCRMLLDTWRARSYRELSIPGAEAFLHHAIDAVNERLWQSNRFAGQGTAMGTTLVCAIVFAEHLVVAHAGDSRLYMSIPGKELSLLTKDHSVQRLIDEKKIAHSSLRSGIQVGNSIFQAVGTCRSLDLEIQAFDRPASARYLWCSDGLSRYVPEDFMRSCMENCGSAKEALDQLIRAALLAGAPDNISAVCGFPVDAADRI